MYQKYSIGTMARLLGISAEAIRYYESRNIIQPVRDPETGYRYYNTWDFHMLLRARHYQNYGFSLEEVADLFRSRELPGIQEQMGMQEAGIQREIVRQINLLKRIRQSQAMLEDAVNSVGQYRIEERPGIYRMNSFGNCRHFSLPHFLGGTDKRQFGYFIDQHTVIAGDCNEIIPFSGDKHMDAFLSYGIYILLAYRQVGRVDSQLLSQPAVDGFSGKELLRLLDGISGCSLICEADPIFQGIGRGKLSRCSHRCSQDQCR